MYTNTSYNKRLHIAHFPLLYFPLLYSLLLTWLPPAVTGIVHLNPRLPVNWLPLSPIVPLYPSLRSPDPSWVFPRLNVHPIRAISQTRFPVYDTENVPFYLGSFSTFIPFLPSVILPSVVFYLRLFSTLNHSTFDLSNFCHSRFGDGFQ